MSMATKPSDTYRYVLKQSLTKSRSGQASQTGTWSVRSVAETIDVAGRSGAIIGPSSSQLQALNRCLGTQLTGQSEKRGVSSRLMGKISTSIA